MLSATDQVAQLTLTRDFRTKSLQAMPCADSPAGQAVVKLDYTEFNATEWQPSLQAPTSAKSPLYDNLKSADFVVQFPSKAPVELHWSKGSHSELEDFQPFTGSLPLGKPFPLQSFGGRSSDGVMPYFNLAGEGGGLIVAVGWPGDWKATFETVGEGQIRVTAGLQRSHFKLEAREKVRLPSVLLMSYRGDWLDGQNQFRRLMLKHFTPATHPAMDLMPVAASVHGMIGFNDTTETNLSKLAADIGALKLPLDSYWLDAGWNQGGFPIGQGNPNPDPARFPHGLGPVGEAVRKAGLRFIVWFEPERIMRGTWMEREHPDWLLLPTGTPNELRYMEKDGFRLLDLGNPQARAWALDMVSRNIREAGIAIYRQDFNQYPSYFWHTDEPSDEIGLREVRHINGLYEFLDQLAKRHPGLILDNCASGGRRLDFEMMRRCVVLWRSDSCWDDKKFPRNVQAMTHGLSLWFPLHGLGAAATDDVALRSGMGACASFAINFRNTNAIASLSKFLDRYVKIRALFAADYYPLTEWSGDPKRWLAFQFNDPVKGEGIVQAFCGASATEPRKNLKLKGLDSAAKYELESFDGDKETRSGRDLAEQGLAVTAKTQNTALVFSYKRLKQ